MATTRFKGLRVRKNSGTFGSRAAGSLVPGSVNWDESVAMPIDRADLTLPGEVRQTEQDLGKASDYQNLPDADQVDDDADKVYVRPGSITFATRVDTIGDLTRGVFHPDHHWLYWLVNTFMADLGTHKAASTADTVSGAPTATTFDVADASAYQAGDVVVFGLQSARIESIAVNTITHSGGLVGLADTSAITIDRLVRSDTVSAQLTTTSFTATDAAAYAVGKLFRVIQDGLARYALVLDIDGATIHHTALPSAIAAASEIRIMRTFHKGGYGDSVDMRADSEGAAALLWGCRVSQVTTEVAAGNDSPTLAKLNWTVSIAHVEFDHANAEVVDPPDVLARPANFLGADRFLSAALPNVEVQPGVNAHEHQLDVDSLNFGLEMTLAPKVHKRDVIGMADMVVNSRAMTLDMVTSEGVAVGDDKANKRKRHLSVGWGPQREGEGMAIFVPSSFQKGDPDKTNISGDLDMFDLSFGDWRGVSATGSGAESTASLFWGFGE